MKSRVIAISSWLCLSAVLGACGGDDDNPPPEGDAGVDGGPVAGSGGSGGKGGQGGGGHGAQGGGGAGGGDVGGSGGSGGSGGGGADEYTVGGEVSGLNGTGLVIKLNDVEETAVSENGDFTFDTKLSKDDEYTVTVKTQPTNPVQACSVVDGNGTIDDADVDNVKINCSNVTRSVGGAVAGLGGGEIKLRNNGGDELTVGADGNFTFQTALQPGADYAVTVSTAPAGRTCSVANGTGEVGGSNITDVSVNCYAGLTLAARARVGSVALSWEGNGATSYTVHRSTAADCDFANPTGCAGHAEQANVQAPYIWAELTNGTVYYFAVVGNHPNDFHTRSTNLTGARPNGAEFDDEVHALALGNNNTVYAGGQFESIGPYTGPLAPIDRTTGRTSRIPNFPIITSSTSGSPVSAVLADGNGGYFVGGTFEITAGSTTINNLAHINANGTLDETWNPMVSGGEVVHLARVEDTLYIAGSFTEVGGTMRAGLAAVSATAAGAVDATWNPDPDGSISSLVANTTGVFVAGGFEHFGAVERDELAGLNRTDGALISGFPASPDDEVTALALTTDRLYLSGYFTNVGGQMRARLAGIDLTNNTLVANVELSPSQATPPDALAVVGDHLYLGGDFTSVETSVTAATPRDRLAAIDLGTGALTDWNPGADGRVRALAASGETLYVAGGFRTIAGVARRHLAAIGTNGTLSGWAPEPGADVDGISVDSDTVYAFGSTVRTFGVEARPKLAAFRNGTLLSWDPVVAGGDVLALAAAGDTVYVGGTFDTVGGVQRHGAAAVSDANAVRDWNAQLNENGEVNAILVGGGLVYLGGSFSEGGGDARANLVAVSTDTGARPAAWTVDGVNGRVRALALDGTSLYIGGDFGSVDGAGSDGDDARDKLAKLDASSGANDDPWDPGGADATVRALAIIGDRLFVGGDFANLDGAGHTRLGVIDKTDASVDNTWNPMLNGPVNAFATFGNVLYVGGAFTDLATRLAVFQVESSITLAAGMLGVEPFGQVRALTADENSLFLGGDIREARIGGEEPMRCWFHCGVPRPVPVL